MLIIFYWPVLYDGWSQHSFAFHIFAQLSEEYAAREIRLNNYIYLNMKFYMAFKFQLSISLKMWDVLQEGDLRVIISMMLTKRCFFWADTDVKQCLQWW